MSTPTRTINLALLSERERIIARGADVVSTDRLGVSRVPADWVARLREFQRKNPKATHEQTSSALAIKGFVPRGTEA
jgi:hypothetical protein